MKEKREFVEVNKLSEQIKFEHNYLRAVFYEDDYISLADVDRAMSGIESTKKNKITEEEIVKPYLDKIRAEIEQRPYGLANDSVIQGMKYERMVVLEILDKYKAESEEQWQI